MAHAPTDAAVLVGAMDADLAGAAAEVVEHLREGRRPEGIGTVGTVGIGLLEQLDEEVAAGRGR